MKRILAGLICGVALTGLTLGTAAASKHGYYEGHHGENEAYEHGRAYYNPSSYTNYGYTNYSYPVNGYSNHEAREYNAGYGYSDESYEHRNRYNTGIVYPNVNVYGNVGYRNHEMYEYGR
jgi:hypothetical protein